MLRNNYFNSVLSTIFYLVVFIGSANAQWTPTTYPASAQDVAESIHFVDANVGYFSAWTDVYRTLDGGSSYQKVDMNGALGSFDKVYFLTASKGFVIGYLDIVHDERIYMTTDSGKTWTLQHDNVYSAPLSEMDFINSLNGFVVGTDGIIMQTTNGGVSWGHVSSGITNHLWSLDYINSSKIVAVGENVILISNDGGSTWDSTAVSYNLFDVHFADASTGYACGEDGIILKTTDGGANWSKLTHSFPGERFFSLWALDNNTFYVGGYKLYKSENGGNFIAKQLSDSVVTNVNDIHFVDANNGFIGAGTVWTTSNGGFVIPSNDAAIDKFVPYDPARICAGFDSAWVVIRNFGKNNLTSAEIHIENNGTLGSVHAWNGSLAPDSSEIVKIAAPAVVAGVNQFRSWVSKPNGVVDELNFNDTVSYVFDQQKLSGTYTIGGSAPDFTDIAQAADILRRYGVCSGVTFNIRSGTYASADLDSIRDMRDGLEVVFQSVSGNAADVTVTALNMIRTAGVKFRNISFTSTSSNAVNLTNVNRVSFNNCNFNAGTGSAYSGLGATGSDSIVVTNCTFSAGDRGILVYQGEYIRIENCDFSGIIRSSVTLNDCRNSEVTQCHFLGSVKPNEQNIYLLDVHPPCRVSENVLDNGARTGITLKNINSPDTSIAVINNFIRSQNFGIYSNNAYGLSIWHNTLVFDSSLVNHTGILLSPYVNSNFNTDLLVNTIDIRNNIISSNHLALKIDYEVDEFPDFIKHLDYNCLFSTGENLVHMSEPYNRYFRSLEHWSGFSGFDVNSLNVNPEIIASDDHHIKVRTSNTRLNNAGTPISEVSLDIDSDSRNLSSPDIGADEFDLYNVDGGFVTMDTVIQCSGSSNVYVTLSNYGIQPLTSANIEWIVNGASQGMKSWNGNLSPGDSVKIDLGTYTFTNAYYPVQFNLVSANGSADDNTMNNSGSTFMKGGGMSGVYTISSTGGDYTDISSAISDLQANGICAGVSFEINNGVYATSVTMPGIKGASKENTIRFYSKSGNPADVTLQTSVTLSGAKYTIWDGLTVAASFNIDEYSDNNKIYNCKTNGIYGTGGSKSGLEIDSSDIGKIEIKQPYADLFQKLSITNCKISSKVTLYYITDLNISGNIIDDAVDIKADGNLNLTGNSFTGSKVTGTHLRLEYLPLTNQRALIANNMISSGNGPLAYFNNCRNLDIYHNSFNDYSGGSISISLINGSADIYNWNVKNNVFRSNSIRAILFISNYEEGKNINFDYNSYYSTTDKLIEVWDGSNITFSALQNWFRSYNQDKNSLVIDPGFVSNTDLHITDNFHLEKAGVKLSGINVDFDNDPRPAQPSIGADQFTIIPVADDAGVLKINYDDFNCGVGNNVVVRLKNYGTNAINDVIINWELNGATQTPFNWTGTLNPQDTSGPVNIGSLDINAGSSGSLKVWTSNPNSTTDGNANNDTLGLDYIEPTLTGILTIGGTNPDFATFKEAVDALHKRGTCGPVTFKVRDGYYEEDKVLLFKEIDGVDKNNQVVFESASGLRDSVIFRNTDTWDDQALRFQGSKYITFRNMTIELAGSVTTGGQAIIVMQDGANHLTFDNNILRPVDKFSSSGFTPQYIFYSVKSINNITISNNYIGRGVISINLTSSLSDSITISNNTIIGSKDYAMDIHEVNDLTISGNLVRTDKTGVIRLWYCNRNLTISGNQLYAQNGGLDIWRCWNNDANPIRIYNNLIYGFMDVISSKNVEIYNNTTHKSLYGLYLRSDSLIKIVNNNFTNSTAGIYFYDHIGSHYADYNNLYGGTGVARYDDVTYTTLADYRSATGFGANSMSELSVPVSNDRYRAGGIDLHEVSNKLDGKGVPLTEITVDVDGETRHATTPDIGADEYTPKKADVEAGIIFANGLCKGDSSNLVMRLYNLASDTLSTLNINWELNGVAQPVFKFKGAIPPGGNGQLTIAKISPSEVRVNNFKAWTSLPNGLADEFPANDTTRWDSVFVRMKGHYTIGGTSPDFPTIQSAIDWLKYTGTCDTVFFDIRKGVYNEQVTINGGYEVVFQSETGNKEDVTITYDATSDKNYTVSIINTSKIVFRNLTIKATNINWGNAVYYRNAQQLTIDNVRLEGPQFDNLTGPTGISTLLYSDGYDDDYLTVSNCEFINGNFGAHIVGSLRSSSNKYSERGGLFTNNYLYGQYNGALFIQFTYDLKIYDNEIIGIKNTSSAYKAINARINPAFELKRNKIVTYGLAINFALDNAYMLAINNFITVKDDPTKDEAGAIKVQYTSTTGDVNLKLYNNSFNVLDKRKDASVLYLRLLGSYTNIINNSLVNLGGGKVYTHDRNDISLPDTMNYNNLYTTGTILASIKKSGVWEDYADLVSWQGSIYNYDKNSISMDPYYRSDDDLHVFSNSPLDGKAMVHPWVKVDYDNEPRGATPDIGADEYNYTAFADDAGVGRIMLQKTSYCSGDSDSLKVEIGNYGTNQLNSVTVYWTLNGTAQTPLSWTGNLPPQSSEIVYLDKLDFTGPGTMDVSVWTSQPNGKADGYTANDTIEGSVISNDPVEVQIQNQSNDTILCMGDTIFLNAGTGFVDYLWSAGGSNADFYITKPGTHWVRVTDVNGCVTTDSIDIYTDPDCEKVWPGDANHDYVVDHRDILSIGLYSGETGAPRSATDITWEGKTATRWQKLQYNGTDKMHADCNGDGTINKNDTTPIHLYYGKIPVQKKEVELLGGEVPLVISSGDSTTAKAGDWVEFEVTIGDSALMVDSIYGLAFKLTFDPAYIIRDSILLDYSGSVFGTGSDVLTIQKVHFTSGQVDGTIVRTNGQNLSGSGLVCTLRYKLKSTVPANTVMASTISFYEALSASGDSLEFNVVNNGTVKVDFSLGKESQMQDDLPFFFPNPAKTVINIDRTMVNGFVSLTIFDVTGKQIMMVPALTGEIRIGHLPRGIYYIRMITETDMRSGTLVVE